MSAKLSYIDELQKERNLLKLQLLETIEEYNPDDDDLMSYHLHQEIRRLESRIAIIDHKIGIYQEEALWFGRLFQLIKVHSPR